MKHLILTPIFSAVVFITTPLWAMDAVNELFSGEEKNYTVSMKQVKAWIENSPPLGPSWEFWYLWSPSQTTYSSQISIGKEEFHLTAYAYSLHSLNSLNPDVEVIFYPLKNSKNTKMFVTPRAPYKIDEHTSAEFIFLVYPKGYNKDEEG
jgi:hypothetical protein